MARMPGLALLLGIVAVAASAGEWHPAACPLMTRWGKEVSPENAWREYPRPQMVRPDWQNLNGLWEYAVRPGDAARPETWDGRILVPFCIESPLSGVGRQIEAEERLWYRRTFTVPHAWNGRRVLLHFGAVDWQAAVWVNGKAVGSHRGGYTPFSLDITDAVAPGGGEQEIVVRVWDPLDKRQYVHGKQNRPRDHYETSTGIWQTVWLEPVNRWHIARPKLTPDVAHERLVIEVDTTRVSRSHELIAVVFDGHKEVARASGLARVVVPMPDAHLWSPADPFLYTVRLTLKRIDQPNTVDDAVTAYVGMRQVAVVPDVAGVNRIYLNGKPLFQMGPLDQSYWPESVFTPPSDAALTWELGYLKDIGCNMVRLHITTNPDRWYAACDRLGLLVWQDFVCGHGRKALSDADAAEWRREQRAMIDALVNHPSIVMWVVFNESWNQHRTEDQTRWAMGYDPTRLVSAASGWTDVPGLSHVRDIHDYTTHPSIPLPATEPARAVVLGECGGFNCIVKGHNWHGEVQPETTDNRDWVRDIKRPRYDIGPPLADHYAALIDDLRLLQTMGLCAAVYTQSTDMKREQNGYLSFDRAVSKIDPARLRAIHNRLFEPWPQLDCLIGKPTDDAIAWRYTTETPPTGWTDPDHDDSAWQEGPGPFGLTDGDDPKAATRVETPKFYLRKTFTLERVPTAAALGIRLAGKTHSRQTSFCTIYLNGTAVTVDNARHIQMGDRVALFHLHGNQVQLLRKGTNTLAVAVDRGTVDPFLVDADLMAVSDPAGPP